MKTVRFSNVVQKSGQPETHLVFVEPSIDRTLEAAIKANRLKTLQQTAVGTKTDGGEAGFHPGTSRQFLVFPKSLSAFAGRSVIGIKYDLLATTEIPKGQRAAAPQPPQKKPRQPPVSATDQIKDEYFEALGKRIEEKIDPSRQDCACTHEEAAATQRHRPRLRLATKPPAIEEQAGGLRLTHRIFGFRK